MFKRFAIKEINRAIPGQLSFKGVSVSFLSGGLEIRELMLSGKEGTALLHIPRLSADISLKHLVKGEIVISSVRVDTCRLDLDLNENGRLNLLMALMDPSPEPDEKKGMGYALPMNIRMDRILIHNGDIHLKIPQQEVEASVSGLDVSVTDLDFLTASAGVQIGVKKAVILTKDELIEVSPLTAGADVLQDRLSNLKVQAVLNGVELDLSGTADRLFASPVLDLTMKTRVEPGVLKKIDKTMDFLSGPVSAEAWIKGSPENPDAGLFISYGPESFQGQSVKTLSIRASLKNRVVNILPSRVESGFGFFFLKGTIDLKKAFSEGFFSKNKDLDQIQYELSLGQDHLDISRLPFMKENFKGRLSSDTTLKGKGIFPGKIKAEVLLGLKAEQFIGHPLYPPADITGHIQAGLDGFTAEIRSLDVDSKDMKLTGNGRITMPGFDLSSARLFGRLQFDAAHLAWLESFVPVSVKGPFHMTAKLAGNLLEPLADVEAQGKNIEVKQNKIGDAACVLKINKGVLSIDQAEISNQHSRIGLHGRIKLFEPGSYTLSMNPDLDLILDGDRIFLEDFMPDMKGRVSLQGNIKGNPEKIFGNFHMNGRDLLIHGSRIQAVYALAALSGKKIELSEIKVDLAKNSQIKAKGSISIEDQSFDMALNTKNLDLALIDAIQTRDVQKALLSLDATAKGTIENPMVEGKIHIMDIMVSGREMDPVDIRFDLENRILHVKAKAGPTVEGHYHLDTKELRADVRMDDSGKGGSLFVKGKAAPGKVLDIEAFGTVPLGIIKPFVKEMETARGSINISASLKGTVQEPVFLADLSFEDLGLTLDHLDQEIHHISGHVRVTPEKMEFLNFSGQMDQGRIDFGGSIGLSNGAIKDMDLKLSAEGLPLNIPDMMELSLDGRLTLKGTPDKSDFSGEVVLLEGRYYRDVDLVSETTKRTRKKELPLVKKENPVLDHMAVNVRVTRQEPLLVDNNMAYLLLSPDLVVQGKASSPVLSGRALVDSGTINFNKSEFNVTKGIIDFVNPYKTEARIDIEGEMEIRTWTIFLLASGTLDNLDIQLFSNPFESHADVISLIAFGKTTKEMGKVGSDGQAASGRVVSGLLADALQKNLKEATGMDQLAIQVGETGDTGSQAVHVSLGKDLSRQMGVTNDVDTRSGDTVQRITTFYKLMENFLMKGFQDSGGKMGGELQYKLEFR